ncbi:MAG: hypothetical protein WD851_12285 [Pirellulales bacterium]
MIYEQNRPQFAAPYLAPLLFALVATAGCGEQRAARYDLAGEVTFNGRPVPIGFMVFEPDAEAGNSGPGARADIKDGKYSTPPDRGHTGGPHIVRIFGYDGVAYQISEDGMMNPMGRPLFESAEVKIELPKETAKRDFALPQP